MNDAARKCFPGSTEGLARKLPVSQETRADFRLSALPTALATLRLVRTVGFDPQGDPILMRKAVGQEGYASTFKSRGNRGNAGRCDLASVPLEVYNCRHIQARSNGQNGLGDIQQGSGGPCLCARNA